MALIKCPECGRDISDKAPQCPGCGYAPRPLLVPPPLPPQAASRGQGMSVGCIVALVAVPVMVGIVGLLTAIAIPAFLQYRGDARRSLCINNMRLLDHAKEVLAIKNNWTDGHVIAQSDETIWQELDPLIDGTNLLCCPEAPDRHYIYGPVGTSPKCPMLSEYPEHAYNPE